MYLRLLWPLWPLVAALHPSVRGPFPERSPPYLRLPVFVDSWQPLVQKEFFSPDRGTGHEPLPEPVREVLLPEDTPEATPANADPGVSVWTECEGETLRVRVDRDLVGTADHLTMGTCPPSGTSEEHLFFEHDLSLCGTRRTIVDNQVVYTNTLHYDPPPNHGPIRRSAPFTLPVACYFNRYQYSYKVGYVPKMQLRKVFKQMVNGAKFILTPRNAQWERLSPSDPYFLGKPMYFQAETVPLPAKERLYIHSCFATPERSYTSTPQFTVVKNFGCMVESKDGRASFIPSKNNAVRFSVDAFLFKGMTGQHLYMHCTMSVGSYVPTHTTKSCNYDTNAKRWVELFGLNSVCSCCDSTCRSAASAETKIISSKPWKIEPKVKPSSYQKRRKSSAFITMTTAAPRAETTESEPTPRISDVSVGEVTEQEWPYGGVGVTWLEEDGEDLLVKGSAVVEQEEEEEEEDFVKPHRIFENIFEFDQ
ncbi:zona pellucida sperm-binding protein 3d.2 [Gouania willdenowi]|uniref:zona pellucida sperm-binding protein 3d.2 n=1 Tax=Gouania willdenowi TaxID=441366 RepID=UPI001055F3E7|nr:zona pellucida sperm-binding protein 3-like [Gouania willdenowi]